MHNIWKFLNSRLVVALVIVCSWPLLSTPAALKVVEIGTERAKAAIKETMSTKMSMGGMTRVDPEEEKRKIFKKAEVLSQLEVSEATSTVADWKGREKYVAEITNNTGKIVNSIHYSARFYRDGKLIDVQTQWMGSKFVLPNKKIALSLNRNLGDSEAPKEVLDANMSDKVEISISDFEILEKPPEE